MQDQRAKSVPAAQTFNIDAKLGMPAYVIGLKRDSRLMEGGPISSDPTRHPYVSLEILPDPLRRQVVEAVKVAVARGPT